MPARRALSSSSGSVSAKSEGVGARVPDLEITTTINAAPDRVYALVSDITRMGEWSPEATGGRWQRGATGPTVGARFRGSNRKGWRRWSTANTVTAADPGRRFAFRTTFGPLQVADWSYRIDPAGDGCTVTEEWTDHRPGFMRAAYPVVMGIPDRAAAHRVNMTETLERLKGA